MSATSFVKRGPARVTLRDVAPAAGTSTSAVYSLFGGKSELLTAVVDNGFSSFRDSQLAASGGLMEFWAAYRAWALEHQALYRLMFGGALAAYVDCQPSPGAAADAMQPVMDAVASAQSAGILVEAPVELVAVEIWGQVHGLVSLELAQMGRPDADWAAVYSMALDAIARGWTAE